MTTWPQMLVTILASFVASTGFWTCLQKKLDKDDVTKEMLIGLAHDRIMDLGMDYIERGWITQDEYENLNVYLFRPYSKIGGNGTAERIMKQVDKLPIRRSSFPYEELHNDKKTR